MKSVDILVIGGGIAGFSIAAALAAHGRVLLVEQEAQPGYHATGRSVAFWAETYGGPGVQPLTTASAPLLAMPDPGFSESPFLSPRGAVHIARAGEEVQAQSMLADFAGSGVALEQVSRAGLEAILPGLRADWAIGLAEPSCMDIDAAGLLAAYRRAARRGGVQVMLSTRVEAARQAGGWRVETSDAVISCGLIVNAAGAWADDVARRCGVAPLGITPFRRTVVELHCPDAPDHVPLIIGLDGSFYFKSEGPGRIWLTPHDETPDSARDVAPEELDVALAIDRFQQVVDWPIAAVQHKWAGLRSFAPDRLPVYGFDAAEPGFFWFAGQGGFGLQTAPAAALVGAALVSGTALPSALAGISPQTYSPARFTLVAARS